MTAHAPKVLAFAGSAREGSYNKRLVRIAAAAARAAGAEVTYLDLRDLPMPVYDADLEAKEGLPPGARKLKDLMLAHQGLLIASPENNSSISALLKNAIDWASRPAPGEAPLGCFVNKVEALMSASTEALGGLRGLVHVRAILENIQVLVLPDQIAIPRAADGFNPDGTLRDARQQAGVEQIATKLAAVLAKLAA